MKSKLLAHLVRLREARLKEQADELRILAGKLDETRQRHEQARAAAAGSIEAPQNLDSLAVAGHSRIRYAQLAVLAEAEMRQLTAQVNHSRKLVEAAREAAADLRRVADIARDTSAENEAEQFLAWNKVHQR